MSYVHLFEKLREKTGKDETSGLAETFLPNVHFFWIAHDVPRGPLVCNPGIVIIGQGHKTGYLNGREFHYNADNYLISSVPTAYECATQASPEKPLYGIFIDIDISRINHIIDRMAKFQDQYTFNGSDIFCGVEPIGMNEGMNKAAERLLQCLQSPVDSEVLGQSIIDEIYYRALLGPHRNALVALTHQETHYARIAGALAYIHSHYMDKIAVDDLAVMANMSVSSFHRAFKTVTGESPLQYLKKTRLNKARFLIVREGMQVSTAADQVGYESVPQFSREFKRHFNITPSAVNEVAYM